MNWLDYVLVFFLVYYMYNGFKQGLIKQVVGLGAFFIAFFCALRWNNIVRLYAGKYLKLDEIFVFLEQESAASLWLINIMINIISFLMVMLLILLVFSLIIQKLSFINKVPFVGPLNALSGAFVGTIKGCVFVFLTIAILSLLDTDFWNNTMQSSAVVDLSRYYLGLFFYFVSEAVSNSLTKIV